MSIEEKDYIYCPTCKTKLKRSQVDSENLLSCSNCKFVFWNNPKPVVSVIIVKNGKIFMLQRAREPLKGKWCLPGGFIRYEETPEQAIVREVHEETGTELTIKSLVGVYQIDNDPRGIHIDIIYFGDLKGEIQLSLEDSTYAFYKIDDLPLRIAYKHREAILDWKKSFKPYTSVTLLAENNKDELLLVQVKSGNLRGKWVLPGGFIEEGESPEEAVRRELQEETGVKYEGKLELLDVVKDTLHPNGWGIEIFYKAVDFLNPKLVTATQETVNAKYFNRNNLPTNMNHMHVDIILKYHNI